MTMDLMKNVMNALIHVTHVPILLHVMTVSQPILDILMLILVVVIWDIMMMERVNSVLLVIILVSLVQVV